MVLRIAKDCLVRGRCELIDTSMDGRSERMSGRGIEYSLDVFVEAIRCHSEFDPDLTCRSSAVRRPLACEIQHKAFFRR